MKILVIIPARGGSKGIPRKNLRPLNGKPLIYYSIQTALRSVYKPDVFVTTDDDEIAFFAEKFGAQVHIRNPDLAGDLITLDPVIHDAFMSIQIKLSKKFDLVITLQPTSPLLTSHSLDQAIRKMINSPETETILSVVNDTHLTWGKNEEGFHPNYKARVNRQQLPQNYKETGGFFISRSHIITPKSRIGGNVDLFEVPSGESIDIDSFEDWNLCEYLLNRKRIVFCVTGYPEIGLGHIYNTLILANQIMNHRIIFLVDKKSTLGFSKIKENNFEVYLQEESDIIIDIAKFEPDVVINDRLDTTAEYVKGLKSRGYIVVNIEDLGEGALFADLVVNAIYPEKKALANHYFGPDYFCARDEFVVLAKKEIKSEVNSVLLSFGGVDPNNLTYKVLQAIYSFCVTQGISIKVVLGLGYQNDSSLEEFPGIEIHRNVKNISDFMFNADIAFSSAGRTIYELALVGVPSIIMAQNQRELTHFFASEEHGFVNLGLGINVLNEALLEEFKALVFDFNTRLSMHEKMGSHNIRKGRMKVIKLINELINNKNEY